MLFDTTFVIDLEREFARSRPGRAVAFLHRHPETIPAISIITFYEFAEGFEKEQEEACRRALSRYKTLPLTEAVAWQAAQLSREPREAGDRIGDNDVLIAATALCHNISLVTRNTEHFRRITGLHLVSY